MWLGNCVGVGNLKPFLLFLVFSGITCALFSVLCFMVAFNLAGSLGPSVIFKYSSGSNLGKKVLIVIAVLFGMSVILGYYTYDLYDQVRYGVDRNQTTVENYKEIYGVKVVCS